MLGRYLISLQPMPYLFANTVLTLGNPRMKETAHRFTWCEHRLRINLNSRSQDSGSLKLHYPTEIGVLQRGAMDVMLSFPVATLKK